MYQLTGSLLALFAIFAAVAGAPVAGAVFALLTFVRVLVANSGRRTRPAQYGAPSGAVYGMLVVR